METRACKFKYAKAMIPLLIHDDSEKLIGAGRASCYGQNILCCDHFDLVAQISVFVFVESYVRGGNREAIAQSQKTHNTHKNLFLQYFRNASLHPVC